MKHLLTLFLAAFSAYVYAGPKLPWGSSGKWNVIAGIKSIYVPWSCYSTGGKPVPITQSLGDVVTLTIPSPADRIQCVAFLTVPMVQDLTGKTINVQLSIAETGTPSYRACYPSTCPVPPNLRLYFTTVPGPYSVKAANANPKLYFWADVSAVDMGSGYWAISVPLYASDWSDALGVAGSDEPEAFSAAIKGCQQIGFAFGSCYFDVGLGLADTLGTSTLHVQSFTVQ